MEGRDVVPRVAGVDVELVGGQIVDECHLLSSQVSLHQLARPEELHKAVERRLPDFFRRFSSLRVERDLNDTLVAMRNDALLHHREDGVSRQQIDRSAGADMQTDGGNRQFSQLMAPYAKKSPPKEKP